jgi:anti-anti-sigma regulatory factor
MEISTKNNGSSVTLSLQGNLSIRWACELKTALQDCFNASDVCLLDLSGMTAIDLSIVQTLYSAWKTAEKSRSQFGLLGDPPDEFKQFVSDAGYGDIDWLCFGSKTSD